MLHETKSEYQEYSNKIIGIAQSILGKDNALDVHENLAVLGIDSLVLVRIILKIEEEFKFEISDEDLYFHHFDSLSSIINYVVKKVKSCSSL